jgi:hypothetical protein
MTRRSSLGRLIISVAREATRAQRRAEAENRRRIREQDRAARSAVRSEVIATKQAKQQYVEQRVQETEELNLQLTEQLNELKSILSNRLEVTASAIFEAMRLRAPYPGFSPSASLTRPKPAPLTQTFLSRVKPLSWFARLFRFRVERHKLAIVTAAADYDKAVAAYKVSEEERKNELVGAQAEYERALIAYEEGPATGTIR